MKYLLIISLWLCTSFAITSLHSSGILPGLNQEHQPIGWTPISPNFSQAIEDSHFLTQDCFVQNNWCCHLLSPQGIVKGVPSQPRIHSGGISTTVSVEPDEFDPFMDSGPFEVWDEDPDDAIEFPKKEHVSIDYASIEDKTSFTISLIQGIPDIPPEHIL